eukprot:GAHX01002050.1.p3 GENE.GAHX01002050.1~~GAHX01002050.1.p3  ORF type:complete len:66 (-),score=15.57 GAHX01002050.1:1683-1880(-)
MHVINSKTIREVYKMKEGNKVELDHLLYIDDIKVISRNEKELKKVVDCFRNTFEKMRIRINSIKS